MLTAASLHRARRASTGAGKRLVVAFCAFAVMLSGAMMLGSVTAVAGDPVELARFSEENLPAEDMPSVVATPQASPEADWEEAPASASTSSGNPSSAPSLTGVPAPAAANSPIPAQTEAAQLEPTPMPSPTDVAPLEVGSVAPQMQVSDSSLDHLIQTVSSNQPALAASLRVTDQAREEILNHREDDAIQTLSRAISIDASNAYAYFYLGRAYLAKKNYAQAITFFDRAELRFGANPEWSSETLAFEGLVNEQAGQTGPAIACYQKALIAVPGNLMARVGLTRLGNEQAAVQPVSAPGGAIEPPPEGGAIPPPPNSPPPGPADSSVPDSDD